MRTNKHNGKKHIQCSVRNIVHILTNGMRPAQSLFIACM